MTRVSRISVNILEMRLRRIPGLRNIMPLGDTAGQNAPAPPMCKTRMHASALTGNVILEERQRSLLDGQ
jgi:hypothetical protein